MRDLKEACDGKEKGGHMAALLKSCGSHEEAR
jgi:hypothetical protein